MKKWIRIFVFYQAFQGQLFAMSHEDESLLGLLLSGFKRYVAPFQGFPYFLYTKSQESRRSLVCSPGYRPPSEPIFSARDNYEDSLSSTPEARSPTPPLLDEKNDEEIRLLSIPEFRISQIFRKGSFIQGVESSQNLLRGRDLEAWEKNIFAQLLAFKVLSNQESLKCASMILEDSNIPRNIRFQFAFVFFKYQENIVSDRAFHSVALLMKDKLSLGKMRIGLANVILGRRDYLKIPSSLHETIYDLIYDSSIYKNLRDALDKNLLEKEKIHGLF